MKKVLYLCNPYNNKDCTKEGCFLNNGPCHSTLDRDCAIFVEGLPLINDEYDTPDGFEIQGNRYLNTNPKEANNYD